MPFVKNSNDYVDLSALPTDSHGILWQQAIGKSCKFSFKGREGEVIIKERPNKNHIIVEYNGLDYDFVRSGFINGKLAKLFGESPSREFKYEIGQILESSKSKFKILDREYRESEHRQNKYYKIECLECHNISWRLEKDISKHNCGACRLSGTVYQIGDIIDRVYSKVQITDIIVDRSSGKKETYYTYKCLTCGTIRTVKQSLFQHSNGGGCCPLCMQNERYKCSLEESIYTLYPWALEYFENPEEAKSISPGSHIIYKFKCPYCGKYKEKEVRKFIKDTYLGCSCEKRCSNAENIIMHILDLFNIEYITLLSRKHFDWIEGMRRYDFYIPSYNIIIEAHGKQHYEQPHNEYFISLEELQKIDKHKKEIALQNGINGYYEIDCRNTADLSSIINNLSEVFKILNINPEDVVQNNLKQKTSELTIILDIENYIDANPDCTRLDIITTFGLTIYYYNKYMKQINNTPQWYRGRKENTL